MSSCWRNSVQFERIIAVFEVYPKRKPFMMHRHGHVFTVHTEGENVHGHIGAVFNARFDQQVDFFHGGIRHGVAADGCAAAVDHDQAACASIGLIIFIGVADIEG